jgi:5'-deoxynucleotidase YfbR-like HD superfamily hydrolase
VLEAGEALMAERRTPKAAAPRAWQRMLSGRRLDLLEPSPLDIEIEDIAHGLARVARWNGQTSGRHAFSVAQHSLLVEDISTRLKPDLDRRWRLAALIHDAAEYVIGDMISPFKAAIGLDCRDFEQRLTSAVHIRFGLPSETPPALHKLVKRADRYSAWLEATQLAGFSLTEAAKYFPRPGFEGAGEIVLKPQSTNAVKRAFLGRFRQLYLQVRQ